MVRIRVRRGQSTQMNVVTRALTWAEHAIERRHKSSHVTNPVSASLVEIGHHRVKGGHEGHTGDAQVNHHAA
jgi:hypothetical protein